MADKRYFWLKLKKDFFKRHDVQIIESMPDGKEYILFYLKLLCESIDHNGYLRFSEEIPYTEEMLATITSTDKQIASDALDVFLEFGLLEILEDKTFYLKQVESMIGCETEWADKKRKQRELPKLLNGSSRVNAEMVRLPNGTIRYVDEKRYGGNGMLVLDRAQGKCEWCGSEDNVVIHHMNGFSNNPEDLICLCKKCHGKAHTGEIVLPMSTLCPPNVRQEIDKDKEKEIDKDKDIKHAHGEFKNVLLTDKEYEKLKADFPEADAAIEFLSAYIAEKGYKSKSHYLAIRRWVVAAVKERKGKPKGMMTNETNITDLEKRLRAN